LLETGGCSSCALSYSPGNSVARDLYLALGFVETGEMEDDEPVARLSPSGR
jgi:diamine N-acetyltransferase